MWREACLPEESGNSTTALKYSPKTTHELSCNYARAPGYETKEKDKKNWKMNGVEIHTRAYAATRLLLRWDSLYAVTLKTKFFADFNYMRLGVSWTSTGMRGLLLRGYTGDIDYQYISLYHTSTSLKLVIKSTLSETTLIFGLVSPFLRFNKFSTKISFVSRC